MRSNRRTQRRRGSQLKQRKKISKLLKRTLKRRNSFRKKNTYKRRKTNMKRGGRPRVEVEDAKARADTRDRVAEWVASEAGQKALKEKSDNLGDFAYDYNDDTYSDLSELAKKLQDYINNNIKIGVSRSTHMRKDPQTCLVESVNDFPELFVYFKDEGNCEQTWKRASKKFGRKHGISLRHLTDKYELNVEPVVSSGLGGKSFITSGYSLEFVRKSFSNDD